ncbi:MAG: S8 family serine peptidase [Bacteroidota bacterium]
MKNILTIILLSCLSFSLSAQSLPHVWVFFSDKGENIQTRLEQRQVVSQEAMRIRKAKGISISEADLPVWNPYVEGLKEQGWSVVSTSRWLNAAVIEAEGIDAEQLLSLEYVEGLRPVAQLVTASHGESSFTDEEGMEAFPLSDDTESPFNYGRAHLQIDMMNANGLHAQGFTGQGVRMAVFDAGFLGADTIAVFDSLRKQGRILATYDFVDDTSWIYHAHSHGTQVLSTIAADLPRKMTGSAPHASFVLARTENSSSETRQEEYNFVEAIEWADSIGVDIIHASLGYTTFDSKEESYSYEDLDGNTAIITKAVDMAASKGMLITVAAGNEGLKRWKHISVPCDADSVLCIGAVDRFQKKSSFSSVGPTADGRIKPDVVALGTRAIVASPNNRISSSNGTSFASPLVAGMLACLKQAHPDRSNMDIIQAVRLSSDQYNFPDPEYGYGIPNGVLADSLLRYVADLSQVEIQMREKPLRGRPSSPPTASNSNLLNGPRVPYTLNPRTQLKQNAKLLKISVKTTPANIKRFSIHQNRQKVKIASELIRQKDQLIKIKTRDLSSGQYYLHIVTDQFEEYIRFRIDS